MKLRLFRIHTYWYSRHRPFNLLPKPVYNKYTGAEMYGMFSWLGLVWFRN